jgi:transposase-like protein
METRTEKLYADIIAAFKQLDEQTQEAIANYILSYIESGERIIKVSQLELSKQQERKPCPYCGSERVYKKGKYKGVQVYVCRDCGRSYRETTGTSLYRIKKREKLGDYIKLMLQGCSIRCISERLGISVQTSFDWRHKILSALNKLEPNELKGYIQVDEMELPLSEKGNRNLSRQPRKRGNDYKRNNKEGRIETVQILSAVNDKGDKFFRVVVSKKLTKELMEKTGLKERIKENSVVISDKSSTLKSYFKDIPAIKYRPITSSLRVDSRNKKINLQQVNNVHSLVRRFLHRFNGVSSKYLQNYLGWFAYIEKLLKYKNTIKQIMLFLLLNSTAYNLFMLFKQNAVLIRT